MNIYVLSSEKYNKFICYKIATHTNNITNFSILHDEHTFNIQGKQITFKTLYDEGVKNGVYILILSNQSESKFRECITEALVELLKLDVNYKHIFIVNVCRTFKEFKSPYVFACCEKIQSFSMDLENKQHMEQFIETLMRIV